jgi:enoyl-CoA hydratase
MSPLRLERDGQVALLTVSRPEVHNALNREVVRQLGEVVRELGNDPEVRCLILTGDGSRSFVSGADVRELLELRSPAEALELTRTGHAVFSRLETLDVPVLAAINGYAFGGGLELALCADVRLCASTAKLGLPELGLGIIPGYGGTQRLTRLVGASRAKLMLLPSATLGAEEALRIGLVDEVVPPEGLLRRAWELARAIAERPADAVRAAKRLVAAAQSVPLADGLELEAHSFAVLSQSGTAREGLRAFTEKRRPKFVR